MAQFYFLSVLLNIIAGLALVYGKEFVHKNKADDDLLEEKPSKKNNLQDKTSTFFEGMTCFDSRSFRLVIGVLSVLVGLMKILSVFRNDIPVVGDIVPALAGLLGGASLLVEYYLSGTTEDSVIPANVEHVLVGGRK